MSDDALFGLPGSGMSRGELEDLGRSLADPSGGLKPLPAALAPGALDIGPEDSLRAGYAMENAACECVRLMAEADGQSGRLAAMRDAAAMAARGYYALALARDPNRPGVSYRLGRLYDDGLIGGERDAAKAAEHYKAEAALPGCDPDAVYRLARFALEKAGAFTCDDGRLVDLPPEEYIAMMEQASAAGHAGAARAITDVRDFLRLVDGVVSGASGSAALELASRYANCPPGEGRYIFEPRREMWRCLAVAEADQATAEPAKAFEAAYANAANQA